MLGQLLQLKTAKTESRQFEFLLGFGSDNHNILLPFYVACCLTMAIAYKLPSSFNEIHAGKAQNTNGFAVIFLDFTIEGPKPRCGVKMCPPPPTPLPPTFWFKYICLSYREVIRVLDVHVAVVDVAELLVPGLSPVGSLLQNDSECSKCQTIISAVGPYSCLN